MPENRYGLDTTRTTAEQDYSRKKDFDKSDRSFRLRPFESTLRNWVIVGGIVLATATTMYLGYRIINSSSKLAEKINNGLVPYLEDKE